MSIQGFLIPAALLTAALSGCASLPVDSGRSEVATLLKARGHTLSAHGDDQALRQLLAEISTKPLTSSEAVRLALINNPRLKAEYARLGFAAAEVYDAGRLSNPSLSASVLFPNVSGAANQVSFGLAQSFTHLLLLSSRIRFAQGEFERVQQTVGAQAMNLAADTEAAYTQLAGAWQLVTMREAVAKAAQASADMAQRFFDAGNINRLELTLEQAAASQAQLDVLQARAGVSTARSALNRQMGLSATEDDWKIADRLSAPIAEEEALPELFKLADASRLDLAAARKRVSLLADALGLSRRFRLLGEITLGVETQRETDGSRLTGPNLALELPLFNQGRGRLAKAEASLQEAEAELRTLEIGISNGVQRAAAEVAAAKNRAQHYRQSLIPLREAIVARTQEQVNFMLVGQFELLLAKQQEYDAYQGYLEAVRDYWLARVELVREVGAPLPSSAQVPGEVLDAGELMQPRGGGMQMDGMDHSGHEGSSGEKPSPQKSVAPSMPPPRKGEGPSDMPTGMESHIPESAAKPDTAPKKSGATDTHQHGDAP